MQETFFLVVCTLCLLCIFVQVICMFVKLSYLCIMYDTNQIGKFVRKERRSRDLSQTELANIAKVSIRTVVNIEKFQKVRSTTLELVLRALGHKLEYKANIVPIEDDKAA